MRSNVILSMVLITAFGIVAGNYYLSNIGVRRKVVSFRENYDSRVSLSQGTSFGRKNAINHIPTTLRQRKKGVRNKDTSKYGDAERKMEDAVPKADTSPNIILKEFVIERNKVKKGNVREPQDATGPTISSINQEGGGSLIKPNNYISNVTVNNTDNQKHKNVDNVKIEAMKLPMVENKSVLHNATDTDAINLPFLPPPPIHSIISENFSVLVDNNDSVHEANTTNRYTNDKHNSSNKKKMHNNYTTTSSDVSIAKVQNETDANEINSPLPSSPPIHSIINQNFSVFNNVNEGNATIAYVDDKQNSSSEKKSHINGIVQNAPKENIDQGSLRNNITRKSSNITAGYDTSSSVMFPTGNNVAGNEEDHFDVNDGTCQLIEKPIESSKKRFCGDIQPKVFWNFLNPEVCRKINEGDIKVAEKLKYHSVKYGKPIGNPGYQLPREIVNNSPIRLKYEKFFDLQQGFQDNSGGIIGNEIITTGGFCGGNYLQDWLEPYCCGTRGFIKTSKSFDLSEIDAWDAEYKNIDKSTSKCKNSIRPQGQWKSLPDWPGTSRQGHACVSVETENSLYCWGGYSYTPAKETLDLHTLRDTKKGSPYGYRDGYKLTKNTITNNVSEKWKWSRLPNIPSYQGAMTAMCYDIVSNAIYLVGGADYDLKQFHTVSDRGGKVRFVGKMVWKFTLKNQTWEKMPDLPGTGRIAHGVSCVNGKVYVLGGCSGGTSTVGGQTSFRTVIDNWALDTSALQWKRLADTPLVIGNWCRATAYKDRYIFLIGGAGYGEVANDVIKTFWNDGKNKPSVMMHPTDPTNFRRAYSNNVFVFDTKLNKFLYSDPLPLNNNCPMVYIHNDYIYILGGEGGSGCALGTLYGQHLNMFIRAKILL
jgi:hypothetical protein